MPGATLAAGTSLLAPATPVRVGGLQAQASAQLVKPGPWFAARSLTGSSAGRGQHKHDGLSEEAPHGGDGASPKPLETYSFKFNGSPDGALGKIAACCCRS